MADDVLSSLERGGDLEGIYTVRGVQSIRGRPRSISGFSRLCDLEPHCASMGSISLMLHHKQHKHGHLPRPWTPFRDVGWRLRHISDNRSDVRVRPCRPVQSNASACGDSAIDWSRCCRVVALCPSIALDAEQWLA